ncbi:MAG TPA: pyridoxal-dependent decarboxylase, partial [Vicinamibacterales bacterium]
MSKKTAGVTLEITVAEMRAMADEVIARSIEHIASVERQPSRGDVDAAAVCRSLREPAPEEGAPLNQLLDHLFRDAIPRSFTTIGPGYLAYIPGGGLYPAALADFIADTTNRFTGIWQAAPVLVQLEANALDWLRDWMGFPDTTRGLFTTGGSMATFNAILCARERLLGADIRRGVLYTSDQAHHSVLKSAKMAGVMPDRVRAIRTDDGYRLSLDALSDAIREDRQQGLLPFAVVSNA